MFFRECNFRLANLALFEIEDLVTLVNLGKVALEMCKDVLTYFEFGLVKSW